MGRLYDAVESGKLDLDTLAPRIGTLKEKRDLVQRAKADAEETVAAGRVELVGREVVIGYLGDSNGVLSYGLVAERRAFLQSFIRFIDLLDSQVNVT